jgi:hypothetical protein
MNETHPRQWGETQRPSRTDKNQNKDPNRNRTQFANKETQIDKKKAFKSRKTYSYSQKRRMQKEDTCGISKIWL